MAETASRSDDIVGLRGSGGTLSDVYPAILDGRACVLEWRTGCGNLRDMSVDDAWRSSTSRSRGKWSNVVK